MNKKTIFFVIIINLLLLGCQYIFTSLRATDGQILSNLDRQLQEYSSQNTQMRSSIYSSLALEHIQHSASQQELSPIQTNFLAPNPVAAVIANP